MRRGLKFVLLVAAVAACEARADRRGATVLYASGADLPSMNSLLTLLPLAKQVQKFALLTTLARYDAGLVPQPYLARVWRWSDGRRVLTFVLHSDVRWHDGRLTTARDVAWTIDAARDPATQYPRVADLAILPAHLLDTVPHARMRSAAWNEHPVGNGPFRFVVHDPHRRWVFIRNPDFPASLGGPPALERFIVVVVDEPTAKLAALTAGELDFAGITAAHAAFVARDPQLAVLEYPLVFPYGLVFNTRHPPFDDPRVRLAAALAIDRQEIVAGLAFGFATVADGPVPPTLRQFRPVPHVPFAPDSARRLLGGRRVAFELLTVGSGEGALEQLLQARLSAVGFDVRIRQVEFSAFFDRVYGRRHQFDAAAMGIPGDPGLGYFASLAAITGTALPPDPGAAQEAFARELPVAWLYHARGVQGMNRRVRGVTMDQRGELVTLTQWRTTP